VHICRYDAPRPAAHAPANRIMSEDMVGSSIAVDVVVRSSSRLGEGPVWDPEGELLWWVDILAGRVLRSSIDDGTTVCWELPTLVGAVAPAVDGGAVVACKEGFGTLSSGGDFEVKLKILSPDHRMNDGKCDPSGRMWAGSMKMPPAPGEGVLRRLGADWDSQVVCEGFHYRMASAGALTPGLCTWPTAYEELSKCSTSIRTTARSASVARLSTSTPQVGYPTGYVSIAQAVCR